MKWVKRGGVILLASMLIGCGDELHYAPITEMSYIEPIPHGGKHGVNPGETLYEVAWRYGLDYRKLEKVNHLIPPYQLKPGQVIELKPKPNKDRIQQAEKIETAREMPHSTTNRWLWPAEGKVTHRFSVLNKGINIEGQLRDPVIAVDQGKVVYAGNGLKRYGNLIILKHNTLYLTAYAHNATILVKEGDLVKKGQKIAEMGQTGTNRVMLHFEVRKGGVPINPERLLGKPKP